MAVRRLQSCVKKNAKIITWPLQNIEIEVQPALSKNEPSKHGMKSVRHIKGFINKNNNNDKDEQGRRKTYGEMKEGRAADESMSSTDEQSRPATPHADVLHHELSATSSEYVDGSMMAQAGQENRDLPHLNNLFALFKRQRRDQEEILHELQRAGIVADPRVTVGGVAYELPVIHRARRQPVCRLQSDSIGLLKGRKEKEKRRLLEIKIKMGRAQERRDLAELSKLDRLLQNQDRVQQVREKMEYDEDLKVRQTNINIIKKLTKGATNREAREREQRWKMETRRRYRDQIRMTRKIKGSDGKKRPL